MNAGGDHGTHLVGGSSLPSGDDGAGVAHASAGRRGLSGDETDHRLFYVLFDVGCRGLFRRTADFANHDDGLGFGVGIQQLERVNVVGADDGIAADSNCG